MFADRLLETLPGPMLVHVDFCYLKSWAKHKTTQTEIGIQLHHVPNPMTKLT